jgi:hypothetical protein
MFGPKGDEVPRGWTVMQNQLVHDLYSVRHTVSVIIVSRMK